MRARGRDAGSRSPRPARSTASPSVFPTPEDAPFPVQTSLYAASKLAGEGLIGAYAHGFGFTGLSSASSRSSASATRTGTSSTSTARCKRDPTRLRVLGDGRQEKSYLYVQDCVAAMLTAVAAHDGEPGALSVYNLGTDETVVVDDSIAMITRAPRRRARDRAHRRHARLGRRLPADPPRLRAHPRARLGADADDPRGDRAHARLARGEPVRRAEEAGTVAMSVIFSRAPLRISLGGGGTDLPSYYREHGGFLVARRDRQVRLHADAHGLPAPLPDEVLGDRGGRRARGDPASDPARGAAPPLARQPARDRLGRRRAGRHRDGLLGRVHGLPAQGARARAATSITPGALAEAACEIEIDVLKEPVGKQDPYVAAHGGICAYTFNPDGTVDVEPLELAPETLRAAARATSCSSTPARRARRRRVLGRPGRALAERRRRRCSRTCTATKEMGYQSRELLERGRPRALRRADARALGEQAPALARDGDRAHRPPLHARAAQRRDRRQARRRRRRRVPARLRAAARPTRGRRWPRRARRSSSSTSSSRARIASEYA